MSKGTSINREELSPNSQWDQVFAVPAWCGGVRFIDLDAMGVVNYSIYLQFLDQAVLSWWAKLPLPFDPTPANLSLSTVSMTCSWLDAIRWGCEIEVSIGVSEVRRSSFEMYGAIRIVGQEQPCFVSRLTQVYTPGDRAAPIPDDLRVALLQHVWSDALAGPVVEVLQGRSGNARKNHERGAASNNP